MSGFLEQIGLSVPQALTVVFVMLTVAANCATIIYTNQARATWERALDDRCERDPDVWSSPPAFRVGSTCESAGGGEPGGDPPEGRL